MIVVILAIADIFIFSFGILPLRSMIHVGLFAIFICITAGIGIFDANAIQFGMDQLLEASSTQLSAFIYWYFWSTYVRQQAVFCTAILGGFVFVTFSSSATTNFETQLIVNPLVIVLFVQYHGWALSCHPITFFIVPKVTCIWKGRNQPIEANKEGPCFCAEKSILWIEVLSLTVKKGPIMSWSWERAVWRAFHYKRSGGCQDILSAAPFAGDSFWIPQ